MKLLDCEDVRRNMRAVEIDEAHLVVEVAIISYLFWVIPIHYS